MTSTRPSYDLYV